MRRRRSAGPSGWSCSIPTAIVLKTLRLARMRYYKSGPSVMTLRPRSTERIGLPMRSNTSADFWQQVDKTASCWLWRGRTNPSDGWRRFPYGRFSYQGKNWLAHRLAFFLQRGPIPAGMTLDHLCRNVRCVNPAHLEAVTIRENILRGGAFAALNAAKTHCLRGHALTLDNLAAKDLPRRRCLTCTRAAGRDYWKRIGNPRRLQRARVGSEAAL